MRRFLSLLLLVLYFTNSLSSSRLPFDSDDLRFLAMPVRNNQIYLGWRLLEDDTFNIAFNIYRQSGQDDPVKINAKPITNSTNFIDKDPPVRISLNYSIKMIINGKESSYSASLTTSTDESPKPYKSIKLNGEHGFQRIGIGDLDDKAGYDYVIKQPDRSLDPYHTYWHPSKEPYKLEAYNGQGEFLWRYNMGWAIETGTWYSPFIVYDLDKDGISEIIVKAGEGDPRNKEGKVVSGPEYVRILNGTDGKQITQANWISRVPPFEHPSIYESYNSRNQIGIAYLDGKNPHIIIERGTYNAITIQAFRYENKKLKEVWKWDNRELTPGKYWGWGGGAHWMHAADVDQDGYDEIIIGSVAIDHDGHMLWANGLGHPDHVYVGEIDPHRPGLEVYFGIETDMPENNGMSLADAKTGEIIWGLDIPTEHVHGQGLCSDIDPVYPGLECYSAESLPTRGKRVNYAIIHDSQGKIIDRQILGGFSPKAVYWDVDPQRELLIENRIYDYPSNHTHIKIEGKIRAIGDFMGDWREEVITSLDGELRIYTTTIPSAHRYKTLMLDPIYRIDVAHASSGYWQPPMSSYMLQFKLY